MPTVAEMEKLAEDMAASSFLSKEIKRRTMIFQCEEKEAVAKFYGLPFYAYHDFDLEEWAPIRQSYHQFMRNMRDSIEIVEAHFGIPRQQLTTAPYCEWFHVFRLFQARARIRRADRPALEVLSCLKDAPPWVLRNVRTISFLAKDELPGRWAVWLRRNRRYAAHWMKANGWDEMKSGGYLWFLWEGTPCKPSS